MIYRDIYNYDACNCFAIIRPDEQPKQIGSILLPDNAKEKTRKGTIVSVSPSYVQDGVRINTQFAPGDRVYWGWSAGHELEDGALVIVRQPEIMAKISK